MFGLTTPPELVRRALPVFGAGLTAAVLLASASLWAAEDSGEPRKMSDGVKEVDFSKGNFRSDPQYPEETYNPTSQYTIYGRKRPVDTPRPVLELGRPIYTEGPFEPEYHPLGDRNPVAPALSVYGDLRTAVAFNDNGDDEVGQAAARLNLDVDLKLTATERLHAFFRPLDRGGKFTRVEFFGDDEDGADSELNLNIENLFFEGDVGSLVTGFSGEEAGFDLPFAVGFTPMLFQNGIWVDDAFIGGGASLMAKNSPMLDISNMDITLFGGFDEVTTPGVKAADGALEDDVGVVGGAAFIEANEGYWEFGFGHVFDDGELGDQDYYSLTAAFTRRYGRWLSNSLRGYWTFGQDRDGSAAQTADGFALLVENSIVTSLPSTLVPYINGWVGVGTPQPLAGDKGLLRNTGINFETDALTGFPKLDDTANDTFGGAVGIQYLFNLDQQIVAEVAALQTIGGDNKVGRAAPGDQYAVGLRYQLPLTAAWILRSDAMYGWRENDDDITGVRLEFRRKF